MITITINLNRIPASIKIIVLFVSIVLIFAVLQFASITWVSIGMKNANQMLDNQDSEYFTEPRINLGGLYVNAMFTLILAILATLSGFYALCSYNQSEKEQRIKYLEKGLENFYIPVLNALETSSCTNDEMNQVFSKRWQYSYLADKEVHRLFIEYMKKRAKHPNNQNSNNFDCDIFKELLNKVKEDIDKNQRKLRELIE